ncbi:MAG: hypothetical protein HLX50_03485 [Alteromonadaceae bacterium]|nr:hypothetical protein [Alteromonadaceae bacterium]
MMKQISTLSLLLILASCSIYANQTPAQLNAEALKIIQAGANEDDLEQVMKLTSRAIEKDGGFLPARFTRINAMLQRGDLKGVVEEAEAIESIDSTPENQLYVCMAREAAKPGYPGQQSCYSDVINTMNKTGRSAEDDANYLMAMKLANHPDFETSVWRYIENQKSDAAREAAEFMFIESSRDEALNSYFQP